MLALNFEPLVDRLVLSDGSSAPQLQGSTEMLAAHLSEHGKFSELLAINVPCPVDPDTILVAVIPEV